MLAQLWKFLTLHCLFVLRTLSEGVEVARMQRTQVCAKLRDKYRLPFHPIFVLHFLFPFTFPELHHVRTHSCQDSRGKIWIANSHWRCRPVKVQVVLCCAQDEKNQIMKSNVWLRMVSDVHSCFCFIVLSTVYDCIGYVLAQWRNKE